MTITAEPFHKELDTRMDQLVQDLCDARNIIAVNGLAKKMFNHSGAACTVGALLRVTGVKTWQMDLGNSRFSSACYALATTLGVDPRGHAILGRIELYNFNDAAVTEAADVVALYDCTIARLIA